MKTLPSLSKLLAALALGLLALSGCKSTEGGGNVSGSVYGGVGFYDPWYYGGYWHDPDIIVPPPPPNRPEPPPRPTHPIAKPPAAAPRPTPMPSIPSTPRPAFRR
jgi:hypothetical protein